LILFIPGRLPDLKVYTETQAANYTSKLFLFTFVLSKYKPWRWAYMCK